MAAAQQVLEAVPKVAKVAPWSDKAGWLGIQFENSTEEAAPKDSRANNLILSALIGAEIPILGFESEGGRLQDVFLQLTEEGKK